MVTAVDSCFSYDDDLIHGLLYVPGLDCPAKPLSTAELGLDGLSLVYRVGRELT